MTTVAEAVTLALRHLRAGDLQRAEVIYRQILQVDPRQADALHFLGLIAHQVGRSDIAVDYMKQSLAVMPYNDGFHYNLGLAYQALGQLGEAQASYLEALRLRPDCAEAHNNLANVLVDLGKLDEAEAGYRRALAINPNSPDAHNNLGVALAIQGKLDEAATSLRQALHLKPDYAKAHLDLGHVVLEQNKVDQAALHYREALRLQPDMVEAHASLAGVLGEQGRVDEAGACLQQALRLRPSARLRIALATRLPVIYQSMTELRSWREHLTQEVRELRDQQGVHDLTEEPGLNLFYLAYQGSNDRDIQREVACLYRAPEHVAGWSSAVAAPPNGRIRVGFLSSFFRKHTIGYLMGGLVAQLARRQFTVTVLSVGCHQDAVAGFFKEHADHYLELPRHLPSARRLLAEQQLDVLFYADIGMDPVTTALAFSRLAPVQCTTWGHPVTSGIETIDYFISSEHLETAQAEQHYSESLVRLKTLPIYYYRPELPAPLKGRGNFGLGDEAHVYACPQSLFKLHPEFDEIVGAILRGDPRGTLVLSQGTVEHWHQLLRQRFAATLADVVDRIHFHAPLSRPDYLTLLALADVLLDPLHFGGGNTSYEGLAFGVPIVTMPSQFLRGRITLALYEQMGVLDCVAHSPQEYIAIALRLGTDPAYRQTIRAKILAANGVLYENAAGIRELEQFFQRAVKEAGVRFISPHTKDP